MNGDGQTIPVIDDDQEVVRLFDAHLLSSARHSAPIQDLIAALIAHAARLRQSHAETERSLRATIAEQDRLLAIMSQDQDAYRAGRDAGLEEAARLVEDPDGPAGLGERSGLFEMGAIFKAIRARQSDPPLTLATEPYREALRKILKALDPAGWRELGARERRTVHYTEILASVEKIAREALEER